MSEAEPGDPSPSRAANALARLDNLAWQLDSRWRIPGTGVRFGIDPVLGLVPGLGDAAAAALSGYIVYTAARHGAPRGLVLRMMGNVAFDMVFGSIPVVGTVFDVFFRASRRNLRLVRAHVEDRARGSDIAG